MSVSVFVGYPVFESALTGLNIASVKAKVNNTVYTYVCTSRDGDGVIFLRSDDVETLSLGELSTLIHGAVDATSPGSSIRISPGRWVPSEEELRGTLKLATLFPLGERPTLAHPAFRPTPAPAPAPPCCNLS